MSDFRPENIPPELRERPQWVCRRFAERHNPERSLPDRRPQ
jgi:primase-polymerase (primpol)-like protein